MLSTCSNPELYLHRFHWLSFKMLGLGSPSDRSCQKLFGLYEIMWFSYSENDGPWKGWNSRLFQGWAFQTANPHQEQSACMPTCRGWERTAKAERNHLLPGASSGPDRQSTGSLAYSSLMSPAPTITGSNLLVNSVFYSQSKGTVVNTFPPSTRFWLSLPVSGLLQIVLWNVF